VPVKLESSVGENQSKTFAEITFPIRGLGTRGT